jgi:hypothetical protein
MQICIILRLLSLLDEHIHIVFFVSSGWNPSGFLQNAGQFIYFGDWWIFDRRQVIHLYFSIRACEHEWYIHTYNCITNVFRKYLKTEIERHRPALGSCLGAFSSTFPVAFLEPHLNKHNQFSLLNRIADHSLEAQG